MEKRKTKLSKILIQFDEITDEKLNLQENLDTIINQVFSAVNHVKTKQDSMKQKEVSDVYKYCLDILKQFTEINSLLETLIDENPLEALHCQEQKFVSENSESEKILKTVSEICNISENSEMESLSHILDNDNSILPDTNDVKSEEFDIQNLKKSVQKLSAKVGLNNHNFLDMEGYYEKSSTNVIFPDSSSSLSTASSNVREYEIPEKDTNVQPSCSYQVVSPDISSDETTVKDSEQSGSPLICFSEENSEDTSDIDILRESVINKLHSNTKINDNDNHINKCTALEKLNNYRSPAIQDNSIVNLYLPDIKLIPSGTVIQNVIHEKQMKKKKDKKRKNEETIFYELKPKEAPKIDQECVISHIETPSEFYIHVVDDSTVLIDEFNDIIMEYYTKYDTKVKYESKEAALNELGRFCVCYIAKDNAWYRAEVLNGYINEKHDEVIVQLVDFGNKKLISYKNLKPLTDTLCQHPILAIRCHFPLLFPPDSTHLHRLTKWPTSSIEGFLNISGIFSVDNNVKFFKIVYAHQNENSVAIDLYYPEFETEENTLGQVLLDTGLAVQLIDEYDEDQMDLELYLDDIENVEIDNINEAIIGYDPRDEARICRFTKRDGTCFKGKNCKLEHIPLPKDGFTTDKEAVFTEAMYTLPMPQIGSSVKILITGYIDVCQFYIQILNIPYTLGTKKYVMDKDFYLLLEAMNSRDIVKTYETFKVAPALGEIVVVMHWKKLSRGIVREILMGDNAEKAEAQVFLVDFGEYVKVSIKELRKIKPHYLKLPFQAVGCYIHNYEMNKNCSQKEAKEFFYKNLYFKNFTAITMSSYPPLKVQLKNQNGLIDVGATLSAKGFAIKRIVDMNANDYCPLELC